jgi:archaellum component FlaC
MGINHTNLQDPKVITDIVNQLTTLSLAGYLPSGDAQISQQLAVDLARLMINAKPYNGSGEVIRAMRQVMTSTNTSASNLQQLTDILIWNRLPGTGGISNANPAKLHFDAIAIFLRDMSAEELIYLPESIFRAINDALSQKDGAYDSDEIHSSMRAFLYEAAYDLAHNQNNIIAPTGNYIYKHLDIIELARFNDPNRGGVSSDEYRLMKQERNEARAQVDQMQDSLDDLAVEYNRLSVNTIDSEFLPIAEQSQAELDQLNQQLLKVQSSIKLTDDWTDEVEAYYEKNRGDLIARLSCDFANRLVNEREAVESYLEAQIGHLQAVLDHANAKLDWAEGVRKNVDDATLDEIQTRISRLEDDMPYLIDEIKSAKQQMQVAANSAHEIKTILFQAIQLEKPENAPKKGFWPWSKGRPVLPEDLDAIPLSDMVAEVKNRISESPIQPEAPANTGYVASTPTPVNHTPQPAAAATTAAPIGVAVQATIPRYEIRNGRAVPVKDKK